MEDLFLPFDGIIDFVLLRREELCSEASDAGAVVVFFVFGLDLAVFFGSRESVVADGAGPGLGLVGHGFRSGLFL